MAKLIEQLQAGYKRHYRPVVVFAVGIVIAVSYGLFVEKLSNGSGMFPPTSPVVEEVSTVASSTQWFPESLPRRLHIPAVGIEATFGRPLGLTSDGTVAVPDSYEDVGWYKYGPTPGELGPAVILGHVDSYQGPAVFYGLGQLKPGDDIFIDREDGTTAKFVVSKLSRHRQADFPTEQVYGDIDHAGLRLITCTGVYSHTTLRYSHNLIVFAELVEK
ncbi:class F sortase [Candidatus Kaiserbacteria bacterium]|nr:class F sortase [Candidatus Kaiserbacteria bacterium]NCT01645.1 class F sortase [Candidatus Parcubacteria bacterium]